MIDYLNVTEILDEQEYKTILLYLILNAYAVKYYLNDNNDMNLYDNHLK